MKIISVKKTFMLSLFVGLLNTEIVLGATKKLDKLISSVSYHGISGHFSRIPCSIDMSIYEDKNQRQYTVYKIKKESFKVMFNNARNFPNENKAQASTYKSKVLGWGKNLIIDVFFEGNEFKKPVQFTVKKRKFRFWRGSKTQSQLMSCVQLKKTL